MNSRERSTSPPSEESIKNFVERYVNEFRCYLEKQYPERKNDFILYTGYPYYVTVYVNKRITRIEYQLNKDAFVIEVKVVDEVPKYEKRTGYIVQGFSNRYLARILSEPEKEARRDVDAVFQYEELQREEAEYWEREYVQYIEDDINTTVENYISYIKTAYDVRDKTCSVAKGEICNVVKIVFNAPNIVDVSLKLGCFTLIGVVDQVADDIESSLFLATHGRYGPAMALLRRWLETTLIALYFDVELKRHEKTSRTYQDLNQKRDIWVEKSRHVKFTGEYGILERLVDPDTDYVASEILKKTTKLSAAVSFKQYVEQLYGNLSKFVHYGGTRPLDELSLEFATFDEGRFKEWYTRFSQVYEICNLLTAIKFPEILLIYDQIQGKLAPTEQIPLLTYEQTEMLKKTLNVKCLDRESEEH